jgi:hypothetical protein
MLLVHGMPYHMQSPFGLMLEISSAVSFDCDLLCGNLCLNVLLGIEPWTFHQHIGEAVFIPAGCPFQVKNLQVCPHSFFL